MKEWIVLGIIVLLMILCYTTLKRHPDRKRPIVPVVPEIQSASKNPS